MKKVILYIASSLNGYISRLDGSVDWLDAIPNPDKTDYGYFDFYNSCDVTLQGNNTYKFILDSGHDFPYTSTKNYVFTRNVKLTDNEDVTFIKEGIVDFVTKLKNEEGKNIWLIGGGAINTLMLHNRLIDEIWIHVMPVVIDKGIKLFNSLDQDVSLSLKSSQTYSSGVTEMKYKVNYP